MVSGVWCVCNVFFVGNSSSFIDDSVLMMDATNRVVRLFNEYVFRSLDV
ncbi:hypothetical protein T4D_10093 [Trichinella pseudospiralis]|uniref:Uncharacterized protein n=1 Tax=Trichinella pseudospiralis TaxID=6337 RepID=A0A0V1F4S8_TRIPS|nr:hypothetical protein T4D_10093 [Trichinella pseudospiralis]